MPAQPSSGNTAAYTDPLLTQVGIGHISPFGYLDAVCPTVTVGKKTGKYPKFTAEDFQRALAEDATGEGKFARIGYGLTQESYECTTRGIEVTVSDELRESWDLPVGADVMATRLGMDAHTLKRQVVLSTLISGTTWGGSYDASSGSGTQWDEASEVALDNIDTGLQAIADKIGVDGNTVATTNKVFRALRKAPSIKSFISGGATPQNPAIATANALKAIFPSLERIVVTPDIRVTSKEGATTTTRANVFANYFFIGYIPMNPQFGMPSAMYNFQWKGPQVRTYREDRYRRGVIQAIASYVPKATMTDAGYLISNVLNA